MILIKRERRIILLNKILLGLNKNLTKIIKTFIFFWLLLCVYRLIFIWGMSEYLSADSGHNLILTAIYSGAKLSLQTAGGLIAVSIKCYLQQCMKIYMHYLFL